MIGKNVEIIRETNNNKNKFNHMINSINEIHIEFIDYNMGLELYTLEDQLTFNEFFLQGDSFGNKY